MRRVPNHEGGTSSSSAAATRRKRATGESGKGARASEGRSRPGAVKAWLEEAQEKVLEEVRLQNGGAPFTKEEAARSQENMKLLSTTADTKGIPWGERALHFQYYNGKFVKRGFLLYSLLSSAFSSEHPAHEVLHRLLCSREELYVSSIGGGPGTDASGLVKVNQDFLHVPRIYCTLYDLERSWKNYLPKLRDVLLAEGQLSSLDFERCDVTQPLIHSHSLNKGLKVCAATTDLFLFSYVCNETSSRCEKNGYAFFRDLAQLAKDQALFLFMDVIGFSAKVFARIARAMEEAVLEPTQFSCPLDHAPSYHLQKFDLTLSNGSKSQSTQAMLLYKSMQPPSSLSS
ncbi:MCD domain-containing protein [Balamuthia mandrillaris]